MAEITSRARAPLLAVRGLRVAFATRHGPVVVLDDVSLDLAPGEVLGMVGESGAGKSLTGAAIIGLLPSPGRIVAGEISFDGQRLDTLSGEALRRLRGRQIGAIFQDPLTSLDPLQTIGQQLVETIRTHLALSPAEARGRALDLLRRVGIAAAERRLAAWPHQLSGGMRQRVVMALALAAEPRLIIADEPTTALDVSVQAQMIVLLRDLCRGQGRSMLLVTHDMGVIAEIADRVAVMYAGRIVEIGPVQVVLRQPRHPYTQGLMAAIPSLQGGGERLVAIEGAMPRLAAIPGGCAFHPRCPQAVARCRQERPDLAGAGAGQVACWLVQGGEVVSSGGGVSSEAELNGALLAPRASNAAAESPDVTGEASLSGPALLQVEGLARHFRLRTPFIARLLGEARPALLKAVDGLDFSIQPGTTFSLVGESGCGKSTVARLAVGLERPSAGRVRFAGAELIGLSRAQQRPYRRRLQMIFQDPYASLNPRWRVGEIIAEPIRTHHLAADEASVQRQLAALLEQVGLAAADARKFPHEFSGGQRQRISIARALAARPDFIVCDEPTSALDVSVQAQILNLMKDLQRRHGLTYLFISHNLAVVRFMSDRVGVMYLGRLVELAPAARLFTTPRHPYTRLLLDSVPDLATPLRMRASLAGEVPNPLHPPTGCAYHPRCPLAEARCRQSVPAFRRLDDAAAVACHLVESTQI